MFEKFPLRAGWIRKVHLRWPAYKTSNASLHRLLHSDERWRLLFSRPDTGHLLFTDHYASTWSKSFRLLFRRDCADRSIDREDTSPSPCRLYRSLKYILCTDVDKYLRTVFLPPLEVSPFVPHLRIFRIYPSRRSYRHSSMMKTENLRGDPFFQRSAIAWNRSVYDRFELVISNQLKTSPSFKMTIKYESVNAAGSLRIQAQFALIRMNY